MRKASGMKLTNRLVTFVTLIVICAIFVIFIGGALSFRKLGQDYLTHYLDGVVEVIDQELADPQGSQAISRWLPKLLKASNVVELDVSSDAGVIYSFRGLQKINDPNILHQGHYQLEKNSGFYIDLKSLPPYTEFTYSLGAMSSISLAIAMIIMGLVWGMNWLRLQLYGSELLEERGRMILAGRVEDYEVGDEKEWPATASLALDQMVAELKDARQERSRFDTFIRTHTFLDQLTGAANRVLFDSRLESAVQDQETHGAVILIRLADWDELLAEKGKEAADELIHDVGMILSNLVQRYPDTVLSRYFDAEFAIMLPQQSAKDVRLFTNQMLNALERLVPPAPLELDNWCHIGMTSFVSGERRGRIMDEADMALRSAQLQGSNNWFAFKKEQQTEDARGSVRWRTLLDAVLDADAIQLHQQPVINASDGHILQRELLARIRDENGLQIKASRFLPAVEQVGFTIRMDKQVVSQALATLKLMPSSEVFSVNLNVASLLERSFVRWLRDELLQTPRTVLNRLSFEVTEGALVKHLDAMRPIARMMIGLGCKLVVDQAGRTIVSTHYIKDLNIDYIKLHRSLVREINLRQENQLFVRSMLGACGDSRAKVIAVGVENEKEWDVLKSLGVYAGQGRYFSPEMSLEKHLIADRKETSSVFHNNTKK
ncbi:RNase E specificity factor CsrD [Photobacterium sanguinicancri]|uniref:RNase E specificity factor CsrD n=1 Tax=Photobacterium sanguinicancri TaxID=875932 RepID=A0AAW7YC43_9GAMM|nr:RNase E specificity factor CsrD [Photobacterium sanguinicancri]KXI23222.1 diguanylate phosphodiesterase [Photobacterium sanguinicancri]MDO6544428.1 RNase E specificity factor CsrD [Photobacterium sanguinicancri]